jgi:hypothetical protein
MVVKKEHCNVCAGMIFTWNGPNNDDGENNGGNKRKKKKMS